MHFAVFVGQTNKKKIISIEAKNAFDYVEYLFLICLKEELDFLDIISFPNDQTLEVFQLRS